VSLIKEQSGRDRSIFFVNTSIPKIGTRFSLFSPFSIDEIKINFDSLYLSVSGVQFRIEIYKAYGEDYLINPNDFVSGNYEAASSWVDDDILVEGENTFIFAGESFLPGYYWLFIVPNTTLIDGGSNFSFAYANELSDQFILLRYENKSGTYLPNSGLWFKIYGDISEVSPTLIYSQENSIYETSILKDES